MAGSTTGGRVEVSLDVIIHATEDAQRFYDSFEGLLGIGRERFSTREAEGHFGNPISTLSARIRGGDAGRILGRIASALSGADRQEIMDTLDERIDGSSLYLRIGKQEFVRGGIVLDEESSIRLKIYTPVYRKGEIVREYEDLLGLHLK